MSTVRDLQRQTDQIDGFYKSFLQQKKDLTETVNSLKSDIDRDIKASIVIKSLLDFMVKDEVAKMASLITYGLKTIFDDQDLSFVPEITKKNDKINIELKTNNGGIEGGFKAFGGSVAVIESFLLRILCMLKKKYARIMILDETFAAVGEEYIANTGKLIAELSKKIGLDVLLVTHQKEFQHNADNVFRVKESKNGLIMEKIK